jgi:hypothetical protein
VYGQKHGIELSIRVIQSDLVGQHLRPLVYQPKQITCILQLAMRSNEAHMQRFLQMAFDVPFVNITCFLCKNEGNDLLIKQEIVYDFKRALTKCINQ